mmetsp:Transcript_47227/g.102551  ORF Transcript_47227/g.102551 Transcript_47227/m.102551 type:complete len:392 (-) Transcript_47227:167-1342(-)
MVFEKEMVNNSECSSQFDCRGHQICTAAATCQCSRLSGRDGPDCMSFTPNCIWGIVFCAVCFIIACSLLSWTILLVRKTLLRKHRGHKLSVMAACLISSLFDAALWILELTHAVSPGFPSQGSTRWLLKELLICARGTFLILAALNLSLMWIEFKIASRRLMDVGSNLRLTARFLMWYTIVFALLSLSASVLSATISSSFFFIWVISTFVNAILLIVIFTIGSQQLRHALLREINRTAQEIGSHVYMNEAAQQQQRRAARLHARATNIYVAARRMRIVCICYFPATMASYLAQYLSMHIGLVWILLTVSTMVCSSIQWILLRYICNLIEIGRKFPPEKLGTHSPPVIVADCAVVVPDCSAVVSDRSVCVSVQRVTPSSVSTSANSILDVEA